MQRGRLLQRDDSRIIIHFDYDCFYASVVENENPALKSVPLGIQQKQIIVTCNYEARRRGLHKLQLITEAKRVCPDAVIILGEDLTRFRNASKELYTFLSQAIWSKRAERLGFDEVWLDCTDMIDYNLELLNHHDLQHSFFCLDKDDPTSGFEYDASSVYGPVFHGNQNRISDDRSRLSNDESRLQMRLIISSHLARYLRHELEQQRGYTATVGIATNKILSKLVGNVNKPRNQTTLMPPYTRTSETEGTPIEFMDPHDIGKVPGIGFKLAQSIRACVLHRTPEFDAGLVYGGTKEKVNVHDVRVSPNMGPELLEEILSGPGSQKGIGGKVWALLHGVDDSDVGKVKRVPSQISQEDSYMKYLHTFEQVRHQLFLLAERLLRRMQLDLMEDDCFEDDLPRRWLAHPRTLRLSTRPRPPLNSDGSRSRTFHRISRSAPMPNFIFGLTESTSTLADKLVEEALVPMFRKLHPQRDGWNLSLINVAATNMAETGADSKDSKGRDIGRMFKRQDDVLKDFRVTDLTTSPPEEHKHGDAASVDDEVAREEKPSDGRQSIFIDDNDDDDGDDNRSDTWTSDGPEQDAGFCSVCHAMVPIFAWDAHQRYHAMVD